ncbi:MAG TPA: hypothetical protein VHM70_18025 [Polyangiaceae bacterium]|jgi:hypothetical protein|nr:hypothetical protein [Polyangiaceae bacterium]
MPSPAVITKDDHLLFVINVLGLVLAALDAVFDWGAWSAYACVACTSLLYIAHVSWRRTDLLKTLLVFGIAGGLAELAADWWLVSITGTLHYTQWGPFLIDSPAYMPLSWAGILLSMGFLGYSIQRRYGAAKGLLAATVVSGIYVPVFEALAHYADWWTYTDCKMIGPVPYYIIIGEALVGLSLTPLVNVAIKGRSLWPALGAGVVAGIWIGVAYFIGMRLS